MKKHLIFLLSVILTLNCVNLAANDYIYGEKEQKTYTTTNFNETLCNFRFVLGDSDGFGWFPSFGIVIAVDGVDYEFLHLAWGESYAEEILPLPSGEVQFSWVGGIFVYSYYFEIYNSLDELIFKNPEYMGVGVFFTYQNECVACVPITDFEGEYITEEDQVNLSWIAPESDDLLGFDIYRNDELLEHLLPTTIFYSENTADLADGDYKYCVIPVYPSVCDLEDQCFETHIIHAGIVDYMDHILVYPNPANNFVNISGIDAVNIKLFNSIGQMILTQYNTNTMNVSGLTNGIYLLTIELSSGQTAQKKLIINH